MTGEDRTTRLLILGSSWFVGAAVVSLAAARGHEVAVFNRGRADVVVPPQARHIIGDWEQETDVQRLGEDGSWDGVIDVAETIPRLVRRCAEVLGPITDRYWSDPIAR